MSWERGKVRDRDRHRHRKRKKKTQPFGKLRVKHTEKM